MGGSFSQDPEESGMGSDRKSGNTLKKVYLYLLGLGFMFFGAFAMLFRSYNHPIYGYINFGEYHRFIGAFFILLSTVLLLYIKNKF
jgi:hypothetical protein